MRVVWLLAGLLLLAGCAAPGPDTGSAASTVPHPPPTTARLVAPTPTAVRIPAIGASSSLIQTGMLPDGSPEVPDVHTPEQASWASWSPEPGLPGPAVLYGHVDGDGRPGVFARIDELQPGAEVVVERGNLGPIAFTVYRVDSWPKAELDDPGGMATATVYGDTAEPELRLVTCGGSFDRAARSYRDQIVVFARLAG